MSISGKIIKHTGLLYIKMIFSVVISLYSVRVTLNALGNTDYGIYSLISGTIAVLSFFNTAIATSTQRYLVYYKGKKDVDNQKKVFKHSITFHLIISISIIIILEIISKVVIIDFLNIPAERNNVSLSVYHYMAITVFITIISTPFSASIISNEDMPVIALAEILEVLLKLLIAYLLYHVNMDKLLFYTISTTMVSVITFIIYFVYCRTQYIECKKLKKIKLDKLLFKEMASNGGWNLFGALTSLGKVQGIAILINLFLGTKMNAAYGLANQVANQVSFFSSTMLRALNPYIIMSEGASNRKRMLNLSLIACKFGYSLLAFIAIPIIFEMQSILGIWLKEVPEYTAFFCSLVLIAIMVNQLTIGVDIAIHATGKIKYYMVIVGSMKLMTIPLGYWILKNNLSVLYVMYVYALLEAVGGLGRLSIFKNILNLTISEFKKIVIDKVFMPTTITMAYLFILTKLTYIEYRFLISIPTSACLFLLLMYSLGLSASEKTAIVQNIKMKLFDKLILAFK